MRKSMTLLVNYLTLLIKGVLIGCADIIPGISGSSVALMTGVYTDLIQSIKSINQEFIMLILKLRFNTALEHINGKLLIPILAGIPIGIFLMSNAVSVLMTNYSTVVYATLLGLLTGTSFLLAKQIQNIKITTVIAAISGATGVMSIQNLVPSGFEASYLTFILAGVIAGCFMILPGISGSLMLVTMGIYTDVISAITNLNISLLCCLGVGVISSIAVMSRAIISMFQNTPNAFLALMIGLMLGSIPAIWPWDTYSRIQWESGAYFTNDIFVGITFVIIGFIFPVLLAVKNNRTNNS